MGMEGWLSAKKIATQDNLRKIEGAKTIAETIGDHYGISTEDTKTVLMEKSDAIYIADTPDAHIHMEHSAFAQTDLALSTKLDTVILAAEQTQLRNILHDSPSIQDIDREPLAKIKAFDAKPKTIETPSNIPKVKRREPG